MVFDWGFRCFSDIEGNITNKSIYAFSFLVGKHREPQSINAKLFLPIIPIGIVAYALTLLWDNLCRNSCIRLTTGILQKKMRFVLVTPFLSGAAPPEINPGSAPELWFYMIKKTLFQVCEFLLKNVCVFSQTSNTDGNICTNLQSPLSMESRCWWTILGVAE